MAHVINIIGKKFGRLTVIRRSGTSPARQPLWKCLCDCGTKIVAEGGHLRGGNTSSCGCSRLEWHLQHGASRRGKWWGEYHTWASMKQRCLNKHHRAYHRYGGRGIKVCNRWCHSFSDFLSDMGRKPSPKHSLDRYPNND